MKLKVLSSALLMAGLVGCAGQEHLSLQQQVSQGYEKTLTSSYAYQGRANITIDMNSVPDKAPLNPQIEPFLQQQKRLTAAERQQLQQAIDSEVQGKNLQNQRAVKYVGQLLSNIYVGFSGVQDLSQGVLSVVPSFGYQGHNVQASAKLPMAIDLKNKRFYLDATSFYPLLSDSEITKTQYIYYDFSNFLKNSKIKPKQIQQILHDIVLMDVTFAKEQDFSEKPLTADDKQRGAVKRIAWNVGSLNQNSAQLDLYLLVNEKYFANMFGNLKQAVNQELSSVKNKTSPSKTDKKYIEAQANEATARLNEAIQDILTKEQLDSEELSKNADIAIPADLIFNQYNTGEYVDLAQLKEIIAKHPQEYQQYLKKQQQNSVGNTLIAIYGSEIADVWQRFLEHSSIDIDILLDKKGRIVRIEEKVSLDTQELFSDEKGLNQNRKTQKKPQDNLTIKKVNASSFMDISQYGSAKVDMSPMANAVSLSDLAKQQPSYLQYSNQATGNTAVDNVIKEMLLRGISPKDVFITLYQYQYLKEQDNEKVDLKKLQSTAAKLYDKLYLSDKEDMQWNKDKEADDYDMYYKYQLNDKINTIRSEIDEQKQQQQFLQKNASLSDVDLFAAYYLDMAELSEDKEYQSLGQKLAQIAIEDMQTHTINTALLKATMQEDDMIAALDDDYYNQAYQLVLQRRLQQQSLPKPSAEK